LLGNNGLDIPNVVITDGDPDLDGHLEGIARGRDLVGRKTLARVDTALADDDVDEARRALRGGNVFVGETTLELDLVVAARVAMYDAYAKLEPNTTKRTNFGRDLDAVLSGDETRAKAVIDRLDKIGKGRYAQRLAGHLEGVQPPEYIERAIARIRSKVHPDE
jgi:putative ATP-dependent endonuclease of OLD family